ncbi:hypothetical protein VTN31DRAFT_1941 [Thermomyces dupontii]|uniref:uncharacterized protein n=1 Tax=Talaromyces thermophilus TaxID=28565 RepID=UPI003744476D
MAQQPPPKPDLDPNDDKGPRILGVLWSLTGFTALIVMARVYIRLAVVRSFGLDDYLIVLGIIIGFAYCGVSTAAVAYGFGKHAFTLDQYHLEKVLLLDNVSFIWGILFFTIPKLAIAALLNRILNRSLIQKVILWSLTGFAGIVSCICIVVLFTMCDPPDAMWKPWLVEQGLATCRDQMILVNYAIFTGAFSAFTDLFLAIYPSTVLLKLKMSLRKRLALCGALGLGCIATAMAIVKCVQLPGLNDKVDFTYSTCDLVLWTCVEANVVVIASCIPTLQPLLEFLMGKRSLTSSGRGTNDYKNSYGYNSSSYGVGKRSLQRKDDVGFTAVESQESILGDNQLESGNAHPLTQIRRTDNVTVNYETRANGYAGKGPTSW